MTFIQLRLGAGPRVKSRFSPSTTTTHSYLGTCGHWSRVQRFPSEVRWRHKLAAHDIAVYRRQPEPLPGGVSIISSPPHPRPSAMSVLSNGPVPRTSPSGDLRPPARVAGDGEGTLACRAARVACSLWRTGGGRERAAENM